MMSKTVFFSVRGACQIRKNEKFETLTKFPRPPIGTSECIKGIPQAKIIIAALGFYVRGHFGYVAAIFNLVYRFTMKPNQMCFVEFDSLSNRS